jgi:hypothetical protein
VKVKENVTSHRQRAIQRIVRPAVPEKRPPDARLRDSGNQVLLIHEDCLYVFMPDEPDFGLLRSHASGSSGRKYGRALDYGFVTVKGKIMPCAA